jgi:conjugal transfer pilus assembly protein TraW
MTASWLFIVPVSAMAIDTIGTTYPIKEVSLLETILNKLKGMEVSGELARRQDDMKRIALNRIENPRGQIIPKAARNQTHYYDPSIVVTQDMYLPSGQLMHAAGTKVNPLAIKSFSKRMIFIDATDKSQVSWAKAQYEKSGWRDKVILVNGSYMDVMKDWGHRVYFDQVTGMDGGHRETLVMKFGIKAVPSLVYQQGDKLRIDEVKL